MRRASATARSASAKCLIVGMFAGLMKQPTAFLLVIGGAAQGLATDARRSSGGPRPPRTSRGQGPASASRRGRALRGRRGPVARHIERAGADRAGGRDARVHGVARWGVRDGLSGLHLVAEVSGELVAVFVQNDLLVGRQPVAIHLGGFEIFRRQVITLLVEQKRPGFQIIPGRRGRFRAGRRGGLGWGRQGSERRRRSRSRPRQPSRGSRASRAY